MINSITEACEDYYKKHGDRCFVIVTSGGYSFSIMSDHRTPNYLIDIIEEKSLWWRTLDELKISIDEISDIKEQHEKETRAFFEGLE